MRQGLAETPPGTPYSPLRTPPQLTNCDREPVAFLGCVQSHGALLVLQEESLTVVQHSANAPSLLGLDRSKLIGASLADILAPADCRQVDTLPKSATRRFCFPSSDGAYFLSVHFVQEMVMLELERAAPVTGPDRLGEMILTALARLDAAASVQQFSETLAHTIGEILGFERVMIYRFLPDWTGDIIAERYVGDGPTYKGLRFPATDIPGPAREVFLKNWSRQILDTSEPAVELVPLLCPEIGQPTDLSLSYYRAASPIHIEYLQNMGVRSSLTGSIRIRGELWGLVACHHNCPVALSSGARNALDLLLETVSIRLASLIEETTREARQEQDLALQAQLSRLQGFDVLRLDTEMAALRSLIPSDAVAVMQREYWHCDADIPLEGLNMLSQAMQETLSPASPLYAAVDCSVGASLGYPGVLYLQPSDFPQGHAVVWLRKPDNYTVTWAGDPRKAELAPRPGERLHPRASFESYVEEVCGKSHPWSEWEMQSAARQGESLSQALGRIAERMEIRNRLLERSNRELESFAFMASHDLQEPIRAINTYIEVMLEDFGSTLEEGGVVMARQVLELTERMNRLLEDLLSYAKLGEQTLYYRHLDLGVLVQGLVDYVYPDLRKIVTIEQMPRVYAHESFVSEIFANLLSNASKYRSGQELRVRVGSCQQRSSTEMVAIFVEDNGIGIEAKHRNMVFELFRRLDPTNAQGGSGAGLTIARRMAERHGGELWVESEPGRGATFYFTLPRG